MKPEFPPLQPEQEKEEYRRLVSRQREEAQELKTSAARLLALGATRLSRAALEE